MYRPTFVYSVYKTIILVILFCFILGIKFFTTEDFHGNRLYVTRARESFLERLQREREQSKAKSTETVNISCVHNNIIVCICIFCLFTLLISCETKIVNILYIKNLYGIAVT